MKKHFVPTHFVSNFGNFKEFQQGLRSYEHLRELIRQKSQDFNFGLKITTNNSALDEELRDETRSLIGKLPSDIFVLYDPVDRGLGVSCRQVLFNPTFYNGLVMGVCLDQQVIGTPEAAERIIDLASKVETDNALFGIGSRTVPVRLSRHRDNNYLRCIQESFFALAAGTHGPNEKIREDRLSPAYVEFGDTSAGMDILNQTHPLYQDLLKGMINAITRADMNGFASCYYVPLKSADLGTRLTTGYASARENPFTEEVNKEEEFERIKSMIKYQTEQLRKTDIGHRVIGALTDLANIDRLSQFYPREKTEFVRDLMLGVDRI